MGKLCFTFSNFMKKNNNMSTIEYLITASGVIERGMFYNYMHDLGFKDNINLTREYMINSDYPFGVCLKNKEIMVIESATICYLMQKNNKVKTVEEFKKIINLFFKYLVILISISGSTPFNPLTFNQVSSPKI